MKDNAPQRTTMEQVETVRTASRGSKNTPCAAKGWRCDACPIKAECDGKSRMHRRAMAVDWLIAHHQYKV